MHAYSYISFSRNIILSFLAFLYNCLSKVTSHQVIYANHVLDWFLIFQSAFLSLLRLALVVQLDLPMRVACVAKPNILST